ncbi:amidohydrolase family protein [Methylobacterium sp. AMS5]|uniref:amidohydrolase family protein n=1 Tax=Methylobacterium sp. AMS5 TaxID=925818 RepID=UPI00074FA27B|nr:amidohydrolase family protein [Methylobacterium sp. AMS5]AMB43322.1 amidohydrolase [Methylobacterium sp. AMS5]
MTARRRDVLLSAGAFLAAATLPSRAGSAQATGAAGGPPEVVLSGGFVVSMDPSVGDLERGDVHVRDGAIVRVAAAIAAPGVARRDMSGCVVMPGFVDTHWHMWNSLARGLPQSRLGPFGKTMAPLARAWTPEASALGVRLAAAEAIHAGITTVHNWAHNVKGPDFAEAEREALAASGLRGRFAYGYPQALGEDAAMDLSDLERMRDRHFARESAGLLSLGICARGPDRSAASVWRREWEAARSLGLPITAHVASDRAAAARGNIVVMHRDGLLGPDVQLVHATHASRDDLRLVAESGSPISISPWTELEVGYGRPAIADMADAGVEMGLSVDNMVLAGHADMFGVMRITADLARGLREDQGALTDRRVLEWATIGGARGLGIAQTTGSLTPGKRADVIAVRRDAINTAPAGTVDFMLTHAAQPANVDFVMVDGVVHKENGRHTRVDVEALLAQAQESIARLRQKAGL